MKSKRQVKTYFIKTYGCQMNNSDSERISSILERVGLESVKKIRNADIIIFNSCSVRQSAEDRILGLKKNVLRIKNLRNTIHTNTKFRLPITILTGCMCKRSWDKSFRSREEKYIRNLKKQLPWIDIIIKIEDIAELPNLISKNNIELKKNYLSIKPLYTSQVSAYIPISTGCNEFCTYCIVPYVRGKLINRPADKILKEVKELVTKGYKDIMLLGQNVNAYKDPRKPEYNFIRLLKEIDHIHGDFWLSFLSSHPNYFTEELINCFAESANKANKRIKQNKKLTSDNHIRPYLNLALQSGSNKILKLMNRKYSIEKFISICKKLRSKIPNLNLSTDIIVGFPKETKNDFKQTIEIMKKLKFDMAYINKYSLRKSTASALIKDNIPWKIKKKQAKKLTEILAKSALENNKKYIRKKVRILITKVNKSKKVAFGKSFNFKDVMIPLKIPINIKTGDFVTVQIDNTKNWSLQGNLVIN